MSKNIFKGFDWEGYEDLKNQALEDSVYIVHNFDVSNPLGGQTFVWARDSEYKNSKMVSVSVSFCNEKDQFCRKIGAYNALERFYAGEHISLPIGDEDSAVIVDRLRRIFNLVKF